MGIEDCTILHLDMDAFFASVEVRDDPSLQGLPVVVGGAGNHGVVAAASYPARARGISSAMPMAIARRRAPDLVIVPPRIDVYREVSARVMDLLREVTPAIEQISVDEAFLDVAGARRLFGPPDRIAQRLRSRIREELDLPSSVGGSVSRAVAKIASARAKPDGMLIVPAEQTASFLAPLPVGVISGIGPKAQQALERLGVRTVGQLRDVPASALRRAVGPQAPMIATLAAGEDRTGLGTRVRDRSVGTERTYEHDLVDPAEVRRRLTVMADEVSRSLRRSDLAARAVSVKLRAPDGTTITRSATMDQPTASGERLREHVVALWDREVPRMPAVRLAGVRAERLQETSSHPTATELTGRGTGWGGLESAMDRARDRFGSESLTRGSTLEPREG
ncbi:DNA polymerase IV [Brachybacterium endophyticum]|uniref:DNA polymerase IV n=1 Tax=Brachybacterium endophyticum TaxID=2182385 RepID=A0A2U2RLN8_9MICO|nr:DNA polymerase IV [Brachybacterium endophyticum]PWH06782.1 DNA polymerase IV [Brachybacterium endophyticum]